MKRNVLPEVLVLVLTLPVLSGRAQQAPPPVIDVEHYDLQVDIVPDKSYISEQASIRFKVLTDSLGVPFQLSNRLTIDDVTDPDGNRYSFHFDDVDNSRMIVKGDQPFKAGEDRTLLFKVEGTFEKEDFPFLDRARPERAYIAGDGALLLTEGQWFPNHTLPLDPASTSLSVSVPLGFTAVAPGELLTIQTQGISEIFTWKSDKALTRLPLVVGRFLRQKFEEGPIPLTFFVTEDFGGDLKPWAAEIDQIFNFYQQQYGPLPITQLTAVQLGNVEVPTSGSRALLFLEDSVLNSRTVPSFLLARRLARQWWGYSVRITAPHDAWLQDGFATYAALMYVQQQHSDHFPAELARQAISALKYEQKAPITRGLGLTVGSPEYRSIVESKGAWVLYMLSQLVGKEKFHDMLTRWYQQEADQQTSTSEFVKFVGDSTGKDYRWFFTQWVDSVGVPDFRIDYTIYKERAGGFKIRGEIKQKLELFKMPMDVRIMTKGKPEEKHLNVSGTKTNFTFNTETLPLRLIMDPNGKVLHDSESMRVSVHIALGEEYLAESNFAESIREFEKAKEMNPRSSLAYYRLGEVFFKQFSYQSSANNFRDALNGDLKPDWVETWTHIYLGKIYDVLGNRERALAEYRKALNTKIDYNGAQAEAQKFIKAPYTKPTNVIG